jgi:hypothetical protein
MELKVVGAGLGRTGTSSLKMALERLLGAPSYHMMEVFGHPEHVPIWRAAAEGRDVDWDSLFDGYVAAVDWPAAAFWHQLAERNPDAVVLLSTRASPEVWWKSASETIFFGLRDSTPAGMEHWREMWDAITEATFTPDFLLREAAMAAYERHNERVRATADPSRLVEWKPGDGWEPLCAALGVAVPDEPFPHLNTTEEWVARRPA